jgi:hypothetical protein
MRTREFKDQSWLGLKTRSRDATLSRNLSHVLVNLQWNAFRRVRFCFLSLKHNILTVVISVVDPGCFIPDPDHTIAPSRIRIPDPTYFCIKAINKFCLLIPDPTIAPSRIPDPGGKKASDPGSGSATLVVIYIW